MPNHNVSISQLKSNYGDAFFNVNENIFGAIGIWGSNYELPTYLLLDGHRFYLIQFTDKDCAKEWIDSTVEPFIELDELKAKLLNDPTG